MSRLERNATAAGAFLPLTDEQLLEQCEVDRYRARGPGGQKRNKTSSAVRLRHVPTGLSVTASEDRSQHVNRRRALRRLRLAIALHVRSEIDTKSYERSELLDACIGSRQELKIGRRDARYPQVVAEVLDILVACGMSVRDAAERIGLPTAQLVKFLQNDPKLWQHGNELRQSAGLKSLR